MIRLTAVLATLLLALGLPACGGDGRTILAAGTTLVDSGLLDELTARYEQTDPGTELSVVGLATREVLELGGRGAADILITHAPLQERAFLAANPRASARTVFESRFVLAGPRGRGAELDGLPITGALQRIASEGWEFVTRADGSGTFEREEILWEAAGVRPEGSDWYIETGQGMGLSLQVADQRNAFILVEEGTFLVAVDVVRLRAVEIGGDPSQLANPYTAIVPDADEAAERFLDWLVSPAGREALAAANEKIFGRPVFAPPGSP